MELSKIEMMICENNMNAAQVFTQMKQHIDAMYNKGFNAAIDEAVKVSENCFSVNDDKNIISLEDYITDKIKKLKE